MPLDPTSIFRSMFLKGLGLVTRAYHPSVDRRHVDPKGSPASLAYLMSLIRDHISINHQSTRHLRLISGFLCAHKHTHTYKKHLFYVDYFALKEN